MAFLTVIYPCVGVLEWEAGLVVIEQQPCAEGMGRMAFGAVARIDALAKLPARRQLLVDIGVAALTEPLLRAGEFHHFFAILQVTGVTALHLAVGAREGELGHAVVVKAVLAGGDLEPAAGGVTTVAATGLKHRVGTAGVRTGVAGLTGLFIQ